MKCPHCNQELVCKSPAYLNCEVYGKRPTSVTECCGNIVEITRKIIVSAAIPFNHDKLEKDHWGNKKESKVESNK